MLNDSWPKMTSSEEMACLMFKVRATRILSEHNKMTRSLFPGLSSCGNAKIKFRDFPGFPGQVNLFQFCTTKCPGCLIICPLHLHVTQGPLELNTLYKVDLCGTVTFLCILYYKVLFGVVIAVISILLLKPNRFIGLLDRAVIWE